MPIARSWKNRLAGAVLYVTLLLLGASTVPVFWCMRDASIWYQGDLLRQQSLARGVASWLDRDLDTRHFATSSSQFDGEWLFGAHMMAGMGFGQTAVEHPELREQHVILMQRCADAILQPHVRAFDRESWHGEDPIDSLDGDNGHVAFLGYFNLMLSLQRLLDPQAPSAELNDRITAALVRRMESTPGMLLETYPGERYPVDNSAAFASIALYDRATGAQHRDLLERWSGQCRQFWIDRRTGLLYQAMMDGNGPHADDPRGSGTTLAAYFLSFADPELSRQLFDAVRTQLADRFLGFGVVREYPRHMDGGWGDIDSGPLILGYSISSTGFMLGNCRIHRDPQTFNRLYATSHLFGAPVDAGGMRHYAAGGPLGDALMFAMLTALPDGQLAARSYP